MNVKKLSSNEYLLLLKKGEEINDSLVEFHKSIGCKFCKFSAIGAVTNTSLGFAYFEENQIKYSDEVYFSEYELVSLSGNISIKNDESHIHAHAVISDCDNNCFGGHLNHATVSIVCEMFVTVYDTKIQRVFDEEIGIAVLDE